ncbi:MAG: DNA-directed RNA polymerase subunit P [Archaeoglobaceae archaeon]|nr:DNA-directed RNA polymerase subunit P [Archaeoglobaceae archaeon]MDW8127719.1 DNA-directed RNA polymerase subunit P [Archaeoglobaceae archaeon]
MSYICTICGAEVDIDPDKKRIQCTICGNRILRKPRPPARKKRVKAI